MAFHVLRRFIDDRKGVAAIEFAMVALPLFMTIFVILECAVQYFVATSLDLAVQTTARQIRTGQVQERGLDKPAFKAALCGQINDFFGCSSKLKLKVDVVENVAATAAADPIDGSGNLQVTETYNIGKSGDFLLVQAFLPWPAFLQMFTLSGQKTADGDYVLRSSSLFRNEPF